MVAGIRVAGLWWCTLVSPSVWAQYLRGLWAELQGAGAWDQGQSGIQFSLSLATFVGLSGQLVHSRKWTPTSSESWEVGRTLWSVWSLGTSQVIQWLRIHLPMQGTQVWSLVQEDSTCLGTAKAMWHGYWSLCLAYEKRCSGRVCEHLCAQSKPPWDHWPGSPFSLILMA